MYNFSKLAERKNTTSYKWDNTKSQLPMNIADMDFMCAPEIIDSLRKRVEIGAYGYSIIPDELFEAYKDYEYRNHNIKYDTKDMIFSLGVVPSISTIVRALTNPRERIIILTPNYNIFFNSIYNNGRYIIEIPLDYKNGEYNINYSALEEELKNPQTTLLILCNPHNPVGRIWTSEELTRIGHLCNKNNVTIVSDEIHCDIVRENKSYTSFYSLDDECKNNSVVLLSATKCFNMAGIHSSIAVIHNRVLRHKFNRELNNSECAEGNFFSFEPVIAALNEGRVWLDEVNKYIDNNFKYYYDFIKNNIPDAKAIKEDATYLAWLDISNITEDDIELQKFIREDTGLYVTEGSEYGKAGKGFLRINLATSLENVQNGLKRLKKGIENYRKRLQ
jgi:cystathionine beta-lyase